jgi:hypothetical protein
MPDPSEDPRSRTDEDWQVARSLLDEIGLKQYRLSLIYDLMARAGFELNAAHVARIFAINEKTAREWLAALKKSRQ